MNTRPAPVGAEHGPPAASPILPSRTSLLLSPGHRWTDDAGKAWTLEGALPVNVSTLPDGVEAVTAGETCEAFGAGGSTAEALHELLTLLSDTLQSLEEREERLGASSLFELEELRGLMRPS